MFTAFINAIHGYSICISTLKTALPRNDKATRPVCIAKYSQKELLHAIESELAGSSNNVACILISNGMNCMYRPENVRKTAERS